MFRTTLTIGLLAFASLAPAAEDAAAPGDLQTIQKARHLCFGPVGFAGTIAESEKAFWRLHFNAPDKKWIKTLLDSKNTVAQAYAISAVYLSEPAKVKPLIKERKDLKFETLVGCIGGGFEFGELERFLTNQKLRGKAKAAAKLYGNKEA